MNSTTLTPTSIALFSFRSFLSLVPAAFVFCTLLILPQTIRADYTPTTSGTTVTFTSDGSPGVLVLGDQGGMMSYSSYARGDVSNFKSLSSAQRVVETLSLTQVTKIVINGGPRARSFFFYKPVGTVFSPNHRFLS